jgi:hypothetical protein
LTEEIKLAPVMVLFPVSVPVTVALLPETVTALLHDAFVPSVVSSLPPLLV